MEEKRPVQKRAVETRNKLMNAAFSMYGRKGYYQTTVDEIAAEAGVSTGIAYRYFKNKKDLLLCTLNYLAENIQSLSDTESLAPTDLSDPDALSDIIGQFEHLHRKYYAFHEELEGLRHTDKDVKKLYDDFENNAMDAIAARIGTEKNDNFKERLHLAVSLIEAYCHTVSDNKYDDLDKDYLRRQTVRSVIFIIRG